MYSYVLLQIFCHWKIIIRSGYRNRVSLVYEVSCASSNVLLQRKDFSHWSQGKGFSPEIVLMCIFKFPTWEKKFSLVTGICFLSCMLSQVHLQMSFRERFCMLFTGIRFLPCMSSYVHLQMSYLRKKITLFTGIRLLPCISSYVLLERKNILPWWKTFHIRYRNNVSPWI